MVPVNPNLPLSYVKPTIAVSIDTNAAAGGSEEEASTVALFGEQLAAGTATLNTVSDLTSVTDAINFYGKRSSIVRQLRHALAQSGVAGAVTFKGIGVSEPAGGTAGIGQIVISIPGGANPSAAGGCTVYMGGSESVSIGWTTADTATTIGDALVTALNALAYEPWGTWSNAAGTVTATANAKGAFIEDHGIRVVYSNQGGVFLGPGTLTLAVNAVGAGSIVINVGTVQITVALAGGETPTAAADLIVNAIGGKTSGATVVAPPADYPITGGTNTAGALPLYFVASHDYRRVNVNIGTSTGMTAQLTNGSATDGSGNLAHAATFANTPGAGYPTLTTAVANVRAAGSFGKWVGPWFDATTVSAQFAAISTDGNGAPNQNRGQTLTLFSTGTESAAKTLLSATSPAMNANAANNNNGMRGAVCVSPDAAQPGYVLAAKVAALRASSAPFTNYDGVALTGTSDTPVPLPSAMAIANFSDATQNTAIKDGLTPAAVQNGSLVIVFGRTTLATPDSDLWDWSWIDQADDHRRDYRAQAAGTFAGAALIPDGTLPASRKDVSPLVLNGFSRAEMRRWEAQGTYVGATALAPLCQAQINPSNKGRADIVYPESPKTPLHQLGVVATRSPVPA